jgi:hypothetical protein
MFRRLVKTAEIQIDGRMYGVQYFAQETSHGGCRFSCEVQLAAADCIIIDDDTLTGLELKVGRLAPAMVYSRLLAARRSVAA